MKKRDSVLTICIPTFNRGEKAFNLVKTILSNIKNGIHILVLNNASDKEIDAYNQIEQISITNKYLTYVKHPYNKMAEGNVLACFEYAISEYIMILSDEDFPNMSIIESVLLHLKANPKVGILRGSILPIEGVEAGNSHIRENNYYKAGEDALINFAFRNNYLSGTIYNRRIVVENNFHFNLKTNLEKQKVYPHLYLELFISSISDVETVQAVISYEGEAQIIRNKLDLIEGDSNEYKFPYSFGSRIDQFIVLRDAIFEVILLMNKEIDIRLFIKLYIQLVNKYFFLISKVNISLYKKVNLNEKYIVESFYNLACSAILIDSVFNDFKDDIIELINDVYANYKIS